MRNWEIRGDYMKIKSSKNYSSFLILPMLGRNFEYFDFSGRFINAYIKYNEKEEYFNHIFLLYDYPEIDNLEPEELEKMVLFEEKLKQDFGTIHFKELLDVSKEHIVAIYEITDKENLEQFEIFKQSKYSYLSPTYKEQIIKFHSTNNIAGITKVLNRDKGMLANIHRELGCKKHNECKCKETNYLQCKQFENFEFDFNTSECWGLIGDNEVLNKDKYKIKENV